MAWSPIMIGQHHQQQQQQQQQSRRKWFNQVVTATTSVIATEIVVPSRAHAVPSTSITELLSELQQCQSKLRDIPSLLEQNEWDKVRTILKTPPVNKLWNLGDGQNTLLQLAKQSGNVEWFEIKEDLAYNLQMCDQLTYDNVFVYFQPGNGKIKIKEPQDFALKAIAQIQQVLDEAQS